METKPPTKRMGRPMVRIPPEGSPTEFSIGYANVALLIPLCGVIKVYSDDNGAARDLLELCNLLCGSTHQNQHTSPGSVVRPQQVYIHWKNINREVDC